MRSLLVLVTLFASPVVMADSQYFVIMFATQYGHSTWNGLIDRRDPNPPEHSHTFATFIEVRDGRITDHETVSWLPASGVVRRGMQVPGRNYQLSETLRWAMNDRENLYYWGPFQTTPALFQRAQAQVAHLASGAEAYKMIDFTLRAYRVANCIHAAAEVVGPLATGSAHGILASYMVLTESYAPFIVNWTPQLAILTDLGIGRYPLQSLNR